MNNPCKLRNNKVCCHHVCREEGDYALHNKEHVREHYTFDIYGYLVTALLEINNVICHREHFYQQQFFWMHTCYHFY